MSDNEPQGWRGVLEYPHAWCATPPHRHFLYSLCPQPVRSSRRVRNSGSMTKEATRSTSASCGSQNNAHTSEGH
eukprot:scaffold82496_cov29-Tisochrysis_lutea.AAC.4